MLSLFERLIVKEDQSGTVPVLADISTFVDSYVVFNEVAETQVTHRKTTCMFRNPRFMTNKAGKPAGWFVVFVICYIE